MQWHRSKPAVTVFGIIAVLCGGTIYNTFFSAEAVLKRELASYHLSTLHKDPRPELVQHLSPEHIPILVRWFEQTNYVPSLRERFFPTIGNLGQRLGIGFGDSLSITHFDINPHPPQLALIGFGFLGTNAATALPLLQDFMLQHPPVREYDEPFHYARAAMLLIGAPSHPLALEFCHHPEPIIRESGAYLLAVLNLHRAQSVPVLLALLDDPDRKVRSEAYAALAQFSGRDLEVQLLQRLSQLDPIQPFNAAYALHTSSTNAILQLLDACSESANQNLRHSILGAIALRDRFPLSDQKDESAYLQRRNAFQMSHAAFKALLANTHADQAIPQIRSNILAGSLPRVAKTLFELHPELYNHRAKKPLDHLSEPEWSANPRTIAPVNSFPTNTLPASISPALDDSPENSFNPLP